MKYRVTFQPMSQGETRNDDLDETIESNTGYEMLPDVGDYVRIDRESKHPGAGPIVGRVQRRLFFYSLLPSGDVCHINITIKAEDGQSTR